MATNYDNAPDEAEAEIGQANDEVNRIESSLANAREMRDRFEDRLDSTKEQSELLNTLQVVENEIEGLEVDLAEAQAEIRRTVDHREADAD